MSEEALYQKVDIEDSFVRDDIDQSNKLVQDSEQTIEVGAHDQK